MDADRALELMNAELIANDHKPIQMGEDQKRQAFLALQEYAHFSQRPLEVAIQDVARYQLQAEQLAELRSQS
jgi:hypothetical protein